MATITKFSHEIDAPSHHSSPTNSDVQIDPAGKIPMNNQSSGGSKVKVPAPVTKHSEPVGRPRGS